MPKPPRSRRLPSLVAAVAAALAAAAATHTPASPAAELAETLCGLYKPDVRPSDRWRRRSAVRLPDGREVPREEAYRDDPLFVAAARRLLASRRGDDAPLGAWLLGTAAPVFRPEAQRALVDALQHRDPRVAFEAVAALSRSAAAASPAGWPPPVDPLAAEGLARLADRSPSEDVQTAAAWAAGRLRPRAAGLAPSFRRGVSWWMSEARADNGAESFRRLASLGVDWVSIHTWDPLQRGPHDPVFAQPDRHFGFRDLRGLVAAAHSAGIRVMVKPHLEMRGHEPSEEERRILRGSDEAARRALFQRLEARFEQEGVPDHGRIEMASEEDWRRWFAAYEAYLLPYARQAQESGADLFCVGREIDLTVRRREGDWRRLIARVRALYRGPLTYSANFDDWQQIGFWDALDYIGLSAYFPLSDRPNPSLAEIEAGWDRALAPLETARRRWGRPVLLTEAGFPSIPTAARAPWKEERAAADVRLQARCYEATLRALARRPWIEGAFFWLWERSSAPPFRDPSHSIVDKPAAFALARWYVR